MLNVRSLDSVRWPALCSLIAGLALLTVSGMSTAAATSVNDTPAVLATDTIRVTLQSAIVRALEESPEVGQREARRDFADARFSEARASRFATNFRIETAHSIAPSLDIPSDYDGPNSELYLNPNVENDWRIQSLRPFNRFEVVLQQPLWTWGELSGQIEAAEHGAVVEEARIQEKQLEVAFRAGETYQNVLLTNALKELSEEAESLLRQARREVQSLLDEGDPDVEEADLFQLDLAEQEFERRTVEVNEQQATARSALRRQLMLDEGTSLALAKERLEPLSLEILGDSLAFYEDAAQRHRPEFRQTEAGMAAREALVDVARSDFYPKLAMQASYSISFTPGRFRQPNAFVSDSFRGQGTRTGFGIRQNLNFYQTRARVRQAEAERNEVAFQQEVADEFIAFEVEEAFRRVRIAKNRVESLNESVRTTREWLRTEQIDFDLDFGDPQNLIRAVQANLETRAEYYEAVQRYNIAVLRLLRTAGILTKDAQRGMLIETE